MLRVRCSDLEYAQISACCLHTHKPAWVFLSPGQAREMVLLPLTREHYLDSNPLQSAIVPCLLGPGEHFLFVRRHSLTEPEMRLSLMAAAIGMGLEELCSAPAFL